MPRSLIGTRWWSLNFGGSTSGTWVLNLCQLELNEEPVFISIPPPKRRGEAAFGRKRSYDEEFSSFFYELMLVKTLTFFLGL